MSEILLLLGDMHIGARGANIAVMEHQIRYFEESVFPYMESNNIKTILQVGDLFDTRKFTNHLVLHNWKKRFFDYLESEEIEFITLLGNHDIYFKNTLEINSTELFVGHYQNVRIVNEPFEKYFDTVKFLLVPWVCEDNADVFAERLEKTNATHCVGHFEFVGFEMHPGHVMTEGMDTKLFEKFDIVYSGHYHTKSKKDNIEYIGIPYELTWIDFEDPKGFTVFDTTTQKTSFIRNNKSLFVKIHYDDKDQADDYWKTISCACASNAFVKLVVINKTNPHQFEKLVDKINSMSPIDFKILDQIEDFDEIEIDDEVEVEDTPALIEAFVDKVETVLEKDRITTMLKSLYVEAISLPI